jgi:hypothetical protein
MLSSSIHPVILVVPSDKVSNTVVPVNAALLASALVADAVAMLLNSESISVPLTILLALPEGNESFAAKFVVLV